MKLPFAPPTMMSSAILSLVMLVIMLTALAWMIIQISEGLQGSRTGRGDSRRDPSV